MDAMDYRYKPTTHGRNAIAACMAHEKPLKITRVAFGSGKVAESVNLADVHQLLTYVTDGAVAERWHEDDRLYLTIQYANIAHKDVKTFLLSEFIVYCQDPETGADTDLLYGTLGDYRQPVPAYNPAFPSSEFNFPLTLIISDEINVAVSAPSGLVTHAELLELLGGIGTDRLDVTIPASGWVPDTDTGGVFALHVDIANMKITEKMIPVLSVLPASMGTAIACKLSAAVRTLDGFLRLYADTMPAAPIGASLTLLDTAYQTSGTISGSAVRVREDISIPATGWVADAETGCLRLDIAYPEASGKMIPMLTVLPVSSGTAAACGFSQLCQTLKGAVRVYAKTAPSSAIKASVALLDVSPYAYGGGTALADGTALPVASATSLGMVKVPSGSGLSVDSGGNLKFAAVSKEDVVSLFNGSNG